MIPARVFRIWTDDHLPAPGTRIPAAWQSVLESQTAMENVFMVIDLRFGDGQSVKLSTEEIVDANGAPVSVPLLMEEPELRQILRLGGTSSVARALTVTLPMSLVDPIRMVARGLFIAGHGEVSLYARGMNASNRYVLMRGEMSGSISFGASNGPDDEGVLELDLVDPRRSVSTRAPNVFVGSDAWPDAHESAIGKPLPIVLGGYPAVPALRITQATTLPHWVVAYGHNHTIDSVWVNGVSKLPSDVDYGFTVNNDSTEDGVPYTEVEFTNGATAWADTDTVYALISSSPSALTGSNIIDTIHILLRDHGAFGDGLSLQLFAESSAKVPLRPVQILLNGSGSSASDLLQYIESGLLRFFPMVKMIWDRGRYGPVVFDARSKPRTTLQIGDGLLYDRTSEFIEAAQEGVLNDFMIRFGYDPVGNTYASALRRHSENDPICYISSSQLGSFAADDLDCPYIFDAGLAAWILDWMVFHNATPSYAVEYEGSPELALQLRAGDTVEIIDPDLSSDPLRGVVESISYQRGRSTISVRVWAQFWMRG